MKSTISLILFMVLAVSHGSAQDTFSIVALDSVTGEVGSAGASCVDLFNFGIPTDDFIGQLVPSVGAINTQAWYIPANQENATERMNLGDTPSEIIDWLVDNDVASQPELRQYGIVGFVNGSPEAAGHTGSSTDDYKNHLTGPNYSIQGNILLGQEVLDSMEARFLNEPGDLACKLMAALQGANMVGADTRCADNGTSSLFAYIKVAQPTDTFGEPSFNVGVRTADNSSIEPIDTLQTKFDLIHSCNPNSVEGPSDNNRSISIHPNPTSDLLTIHGLPNTNFWLDLYDIQGMFIRRYSSQDMSDQQIDLADMERGLYLLHIKDGYGNSDIQKVIKN